jgi:hypothetical protein
MINHVDTAEAALLGMPASGRVILHLQENERQLLVKLLTALLAAPGATALENVLDQVEALTGHTALPIAAPKPPTAPKARIGRPPAPPSVAAPSRVPGHIIRQVELDGQSAVIIALTGAHGRGHTVTVDVDTWERAKKAGGDLWTRHRDSGGAWFVGRLGKAGLKMTRMALGAPARGKQVAHGNGDYTDCRRCNLALPG